MPGSRSPLTHRTLDLCYQSSSGDLRPRNDGTERSITPFGILVWLKRYRVQTLCIKYSNSVDIMGTHQMNLSIVSETFGLLAYKFNLGLVFLLLCFRLLSLGAS